MKGLNVRFAQLEDLKSVHNLYLQNHYDFISDKSNGFVRTPYSINDLKKLSKASELIISEINNEIVGYIAYCSNPYNDYLESLKINTDGFFKNKSISKESVAYGYRCKHCSLDD